MSPSVARVTLFVTSLTLAVAIAVWGSTEAIGGIGPASVVLWLVAIVVVVGSVTMFVRMVPNLTLEQPDRIERIHSREGVAKLKNDGGPGVLRAWAKMVGPEPSSRDLEEWPCIWSQTITTELHVDKGSEAWAVLCQFKDAGTTSGWCACGLKVDGTPNDVFKDPTDGYLIRLRVVGNRRPLTFFFRFEGERGKETLKAVGRADWPE